MSLVFTHATDETNARPHIIPNACFALLAADPFLKVSQYRFHVLDLTEVFHELLERRLIMWL